MINLLLYLLLRRSFVGQNATGRRGCTAPEKTGDHREDGPALDSSQTKCCYGENCRSCGPAGDSGSTPFSWHQRSVATVSDARDSPYVAVVPSLPDPSSDPPSGNEQLARSSRIEWCRVQWLFVKEVGPSGKPVRYFDRDSRAVPPTHHGHFFLDWPKQHVRGLKIIAGSHLGYSGLSRSWLSHGFATDPLQNFKIGSCNFLNFRIYVISLHDNIGFFPFSHFHGDIL